MKEFRIFSYATALLFGTAILIASFIILFSYWTPSPKENSNKNVSDKTSLINETSPK